MADQVDVLNALVAAASAALYPSGPPAPSDPAPAVGAVVGLRPGWPNELEIQRAVAAGSVLVGCYPEQGEENTARFPSDWTDLAVTAPTLSPSVAGTTIFVGGTVTVPQNVAVGVDGSAYVYAVQPNDTPTTIAAGLAALIAVDRAATAAGPSVTVPGAATLFAAAGAAGTSIRELGRSKRSYRLPFWAPSPAARDSSAAAVDAALRGTRFLTLADGSAARVLYQRSDWIETGSKAGLFRRDLVFSVEHAVTETRTDAAVLLTRLAVGTTANPAPPPVTLVPPPPPAVRVVADTLDFTASNNSVLAATV